MRLSSDSNPPGNNDIKITESSIVRHAHDVTERRRPPFKWPQTSNARQKS